MNLFVDNLLQLVGKVNFHQLMAASSFAEVDVELFSSDMDGISVLLMPLLFLYFFCCDTYERDYI